MKVENLQIDLKNRKIRMGMLKVQRSNEKLTCWQRRLREWDLKVNKYMKVCNDESDTGD